MYKIGNDTTVTVQHSGDAVHLHEDSPHGQRTHTVPTASAGLWIEALRREQAAERRALAAHWCRMAVELPVLFAVQFTAVYLVITWVTA